MPLSPKRRDVLAQLYLDARAGVDAAQKTLDETRALILAEIEKHGTTPPRAMNTRMIDGDDFEIRATFGKEVTVDTAAAERLIGLCGSRLWKKLFRRVTTYTLAGGAQKLVNAETLPVAAPRHLRALFARCISVKALSPSIEVRERGKKSEAA